MPPATESGEGLETRDQKPSPPPVGQPPAPPQPAQREARQGAEPRDETAASAEQPEQPEQPERPDRQENANPRGRPPFASAMRGGHAYIPANPTNGARPGQNGQNEQNGESGQNGQNGKNGHSGPNGRHGVNAYPSAERRAERQVWADEGGEGDDAGDIPGTWRIERLNGGTDTTPHDPVRSESRGEVGPLIDTLHEIFAQDRAMASRGDSARCGICYLHFPLAALEHREREGFYVCEGCKRLLGHQRLMMVRRQQATNGG